MDAARHRQRPCKAIQCLQHKRNLGTGPALLAEQTTLPEDRPALAVARTEAPRNAGRETGSVPGAGP